MNEVERCRPWIEAALARGLGTHNFDDVAEAIKTGEMQLWAGPTGCIVTSIVTFPRCKTLQLFLGGGELQQLVDLMDSVEAWGRLQGCDIAIIAGRAGWARVFRKRGWREAGTTLKQEL